LIFSLFFRVGTMLGEQGKFSWGFWGFVGIKSPNPRVSPLILLGEIAKFSSRIRLTRIPEIPV
jgi:hypothetical protein